MVHFGQKKKHQNKTSVNDVFFLGCVAGAWVVRKVADAIVILGRNLLLPWAFRLGGSIASAAEGVGGAGCPMRGPRAPEVLSVHCLGSCSPRLSHEQRALLTSDFERGRAHLLFLVTLRLGHWGEAPWAVFAAAHADPDIARMAVELCQR